MKIGPVGNFCSIPPQFKFSRDNNNSPKQTRERCTLKRLVLNILKSLFFPPCYPKNSNLRKVWILAQPIELSSPYSFLASNWYGKIRERKKNATNYRDWKRCLLITRPPRYWRIQSVADQSRRKATNVLGRLFLYTSTRTFVPWIPLIALPWPVPCLKLFLSCVASKVDASIPFVFVSTLS